MKKIGILLSFGAVVCLSCSAMAQTTTQAATTQTPAAATDNTANAGVPSAPNRSPIEINESKSVTPTGVIVKTTHIHSTGSDDLAVGDPYSGKNLTPGALDGHPSTQQSYGENCQESRCLKAKERQNASPYWQPSS